MLKRLLLVILLVLTMVGTASAQNKSTEELVDQAMTHLTQFLGLSSNITRQTDYWRWEEVVYTDSSFGCPYPGTTYSATPNRAVKIIITHRGVDYDYRLSWDGALVVLCGSNGVPLYRSDAPDAAAPVSTTAVAPTQAVNFYAWVYMRTQQRFYLLNSASGEVAAINRPMLTNEQANSLTTLAMSRDGRYLLQVVGLNTGNQALLIFNLQTGEQALIPAGANETISLGFGYGYGDAPNAGAPYITNPASSRVAVGFYRSDDPSVNAWRVSVVDLATGTTVSQVDQSSILSILQGVDATFTNQFNDGFGSFMAIPVLYDDAGGVHFRLIRQFTEGAVRYPTIRWFPDQARAEQSELGESSSDVLPNGRTVYTAYDPAFPVAASEGPYQPHNMIAQADYLTANPNPRYIAVGITQSVGNPLWAAGGAQVIYSTYTDISTQYKVLNIANSVTYSLQNPAVGTPGGVLTYADGIESPQVIAYNLQGSPTAIWNAPPMNGDPLFVWVQPSGGALGMASLYDGQTISAGAGAPATVATPVISGTPNLTCGSFPSRMVIGSRGRSTFDDGSPLNVRTGASTGSAVARIVAEGTEFLVLAGPICADGYSWWQVRFDDGLTGWVAEAGREAYFIEPI